MCTEGWFIIAIFIFRLFKALRYENIFMCVLWPKIKYMICQTTNRK